MLFIVKINLQNTVLFRKIQKGCETGQKQQTCFHQTPHSSWGEVQEGACEEVRTGAQPRQ